MPTLTDTQVRASTATKGWEPSQGNLRSAAKAERPVRPSQRVCLHHDPSRRSSASLLPSHQGCSLTQATKTTRWDCQRASLPSLVLNFVLRTSSPESFPFFPAKVALGHPDKLKAKVAHYPVQGHRAHRSLKVTDTKGQSEVTDHSRSRALPGWQHGRILVQNLLVLLLLPLLPSSGTPNFLTSCPAARAIVSSGHCPKGLSQKAWCKLLTSSVQLSSSTYVHPLPC